MKRMSTTETAPAPAAPAEAASVEEVQQGWRALTLRVGQLEAEKTALEHENKALRKMLERVIEHRQKSHSELVLLLTGLVSKLPINDVGVIVSKLVEHNDNVSQMLAALVSGTAAASVPPPVVLQTLDQTKRELMAAIKPLVEELLQLEAPFEPELLQALLTQPDLFFSPRMVRANRCFIKGQVPKERVLREFSDQALGFFTDMTTDPKVNPRPKPDEIALAFRSDFETLFQQYPNALPEKRQALFALYHRIQRSKAATEQARAQRIAFQRLSFLIELLYYYEHQNTEAPDVIFAQRLPALVEQLVLGGSQDVLSEKQLAVVESLMAFIINPDHRLMIVNNVGKAGGTAKTLKFVLRLRSEKVLDVHEVVAEFVRHLLPDPHKAPSQESLTAILRLIHPAMQRLVAKAIRACDRLRKDQTDALGRGIAKDLGLTGLEEEAKAEAALPPEVERRMAWGKITEMIARRTDAHAIAAAIRDRLNAKYDAEEIRQSWMTLIEAEPLALIKIFCYVPYLPSGKTDPIARPVIETYVSRLTHEKYAATYNKVVKSLRTMFAAKADSPTLVTFMALVRWASSESANKLCADIGMPVPAV
jgi:hypothetical protein